MHRLVGLAACLALSACSIRLPPTPPGEGAREVAPPPEPEPVAEAKPERAVIPERTYEPGPVFEWGGKILMVHYMPWYETPSLRGYWGRHWTGHQREHDPEQLDEKGLPDIWSHYHPLIGLYDSADPDALECQLLQMKLAGINGVIADWYGIGQTDDHPPIHAATRALFRAAGGYGMKFAACFEDRTVELLVERGKLDVEQVPGLLAETMQWIEDEWFSEAHYLRHQGGPLLLNFGPMYLRDAATWSAAFDAVEDRPTFYGLHHLWKKVGADGGFTWVHHAPWEDPSDIPTILTRVGESFTWFTDDSAKAIVSAFPGYRDVYGADGKILEHRDGDTLRESLQVGMEGPWELIQLVTWNDYGEGTMIEPTHEFGYTFLEIIQEARRKEVGETFPFTAEDLRLPARLYALRRAGEIEADALDRIAGLLNQGQCAEAARELDALNEEPDIATAVSAAEGSAHE